MNIREINKPVTAASLNESLAKRFGAKINLEQFTTEQLQDTRNKIRTKIFNVETNESFDSVHTDESYQKSKLFLDVLNAEISERADISEGEMPAGLKKHMEKKNKKDKGGPKDHGKRPDSPDLDKDGNTDEPIADAAKDAKKKKNEGTEVVNAYMKTLLEGAEDKAELVMAAKDMVDRLTGWMEDTAEMQSESMLELADAIRDELGASQSESFTMTVKPALEEMYGVMETTRIALTNGVAQLTGEGEAMPADMGADMEGDMEADMPETPMEPTVDAEEDDGMATADAAAGGADEAGRAKRESVNLSRRLGTILSSRN
jgi:hypothetical protein